jgi:predicted DNA-binding ribbon-helix-helix protein
VGTFSQESPEAQKIIRQMYEQRALVGKISSFVGMMNMQYLHEELQKLGWIAKLHDDQETIYLAPAEGEKK